jgi:hypothetical protein
MTRLWTEAQPIHVETDSLGSPTRFVWREHRFRLQRIVQHWQVDTDWWSVEGRVYRDCYAATTVEGVLVTFYRDLISDAWFLERVYD